MPVILDLPNTCIWWVKACNVCPFPLPDYLQSEEQVKDIEGEGLLGEEELSAPKLSAQVRSFLGRL